MYRCGITSYSLLPLSLLQTDHLPRHCLSPIASKGKETHWTKVSPRYLCSWTLGLIKLRCVLLTVSCTVDPADIHWLQGNWWQASHHRANFKFSFVLYLYQPCNLTTFEASLCVEWINPDQSLLNGPIWKDLDLLPFLITKDHRNRRKNIQKVCFR